MEIPNFRYINVKAEESDTHPVHAPVNCIGSLLLESSKISLDDVEQIHGYQKVNGLRFGEAALELKKISREDLDHVLARQFSYPYLDSGEGGFSKELIAAYSPFSAQVETLRQVRAQLMLRWFAGERQALAVIGSESSEGRSYISANLAVLFAQLGRRTLLIDADLRCPRQHEIFNLRNDSGLSSILAERSPTGALQAINLLPGLTILPSGPIPPNPQELLARENFSRVLDGYAKSFDIILIDTPSCGAFADAEIVTTRVGGAVMVTRMGRTRLTNAKRIKQRLSEIGVGIVGVVLNSY